MRAKKAAKCAQCDDATHHLIKNRKRYNVPIVRFQITKSMYVDKTTVMRKNGEKYTQSRLSATRLARNREIDFLQLGKLTEGHLYKFSSATFPPRFRQLSPSVHISASTAGIHTAAYLWQLCIFFSIFSRDGGSVDVHAFGDLKMNNGRIISLWIFLSRGVLRHSIGRILPLFLPQIRSMPLPKKNLREFPEDGNGKHPIQEKFWRRKRFRTITVTTSLRTEWIFRHFR